MRELLEADPDPLMAIGMEGKITGVNDAFVKLTGVSRKKLIGSHFSNCFTEPQKAQEGHEQVFEKGFVSDYPLTIKHSNRNLTDVSYHATVYKDDDTLFLESPAQEFLQNAGFMIETYATGGIVVSKKHSL